MKTQKKNKKPRAAEAIHGVAALKMHDARHYLGDLSMPTMYRLIKRGALVPVRQLGILLFTIDELDRFLGKSS